MSMLWPVTYHQRYQSAYHWMMCVIQVQFHMTARLVQAMHIEHIELYSNVYGDYVPIIQCTSNYITTLAFVAIYMEPLDS